MWLATHGPATLFDDGTGVQLNFQLMYLDLMRRVLGSVSIQLAWDSYGRDG